MLPMGRTGGCTALLFQNMHLRTHTTTWASGYMMYLQAQEHIFLVNTKMIRWSRRNLQNNMGEFLEALKYRNIIYDEFFHSMS